MYGRSISAGRALGRACIVIVAMGLLMLWYVSPAEAEEFNPTNAEELIEAMNDANANGEADVINLVPDATYTLTEAVETDPDDSDKIAGPTGLPEVISRRGLTENEIEINGNGATIERSAAEGTPEFRIFAVTRRSIDGTFLVPMLTLTDLTIRGGSSVEGRESLNDGGGAVLNFNGTLRVTGSTITGNTSSQYGGGVLSNATGTSFGSTTIVNSTIAGNSAELGGGGIQDGSGTTEISYSTIANNSVTGDETGPRGGGVGTINFFTSSETEITRLTASIVAGNTSAGGTEGEQQPDDVASITENFGFQSGGYNVMGETNRAENFNQTGDATDVEIIDVFGTSFPRLQDNGGPTPTIALRSGSEAINRVEADDPPLTDQRGFLRPVLRNAPDAGAFEFRAVPPVPEASFSPESLNFGPRTVDTSSTFRTVTLTNTGNGPSELEGSFLRVDSTSISGADVDQFRIESNTCEGANLAQGEECEIAVLFSPDSVGEKSASLEVQTNAQDDPSVVSLTGTSIPVRPQSPASACTIKGTPGNDVLRGTSSRDVICGLGGNDTIYGFGGADVIRGGAGINVIYGGPGNDRIIGGPDTDKIRGQDGNDVILGRGGKDILRGEAGDDRLVGGPESDVLIGGPGKDVLNGGPGRNFLRQ